MTTQTETKSKWRFVFALGMFIGLSLGYSAGDYFGVEKTKATAIKLQLAHFNPYDGKFVWGVFDGIKTDRAELCKTKNGKLSLEAECNSVFEEATKSSGIKLK